jgi:hypothetical protein
MARRKDKKENPGKVIIPARHPNPPELHEIESAQILALHFQCAVEFIIPIDDYKRTSPDVLILGRLYEIKSPKGKTKATIGKHLHKAHRQAPNIVIDFRRMPISDNILDSWLRDEMRLRKIKQVLCIRKNKVVIDIEV